MLFNFMKQKQTWKSCNYSTVRLLFLVWSSLNLPFSFLVHIDCVIWLVDWFLGHSRSSFLTLYVNLFSYSVLKCWPNYSVIMLLLKGRKAVQRKCPIERGVFAGYDLSCGKLYILQRILGLIWPIYMEVCYQEKMSLLTIVWINADF